MGANGIVGFLFVCLNWLWPREHTPTAQPRERSGWLIQLNVSRSSAAPDRENSPYKLGGEYEPLHALAILQKN